MSLDNSPEWEAWKHAVKLAKNKFGDFEVFVSLTPTAPLRSQVDVKSAIKKVKYCDVVITYKKAHSNPWFNMVLDNKKNNMRLVNKGKNIFRRQDAPLVYDMTTVAFVIKTDFIVKHNSIWKGKVKGVEVPIERAIDIDNQLDLDLARYLFNEKFKK